MHLSVLSTCVVLTLLNGGDQYPLFSAAFSAVPSISKILSLNYDGRELSTGLTAEEENEISHNERRTKNVKRNDALPFNIRATTSRRSVVSTAVAYVTGTLSVVKGQAHCSLALTDDDVGSVTFSDIASKASEISLAVETSSGTEGFTESPVIAGSKSPISSKTMYDFVLPVQGRQVPLRDLLGQTEESDQLKAVLVVNIKQDDPIARRMIPGLISLATRYGRNGEFAVICVPTDQGYYEPDTSALIRLKLASEYGYGINPALLLTDKVNLLGTGAHPFMRWIQGNCRTPAGLGRIQGNFEKFLVDAATGFPLRRYPRKYNPSDISDDIEALIKGKPLPPAAANYLEQWRNAAAEAERDTYRFQKGLNVFDQ